MMGKESVMQKKLTDIQNREVTFEKDIEYFKTYPAPLVELLQAQHFTNVNSTIMSFGPMLYFLVRALGCEQILEIGHAEGYTAFYLAHGLKDNALRFGMKGNMYYGIDIIKTEIVREELRNRGLPSTILNLDSMKLTPETFKDITFDMIFQDGNHDAEHVLYELETMYPQLKGKGKGYLVFHDCYGPAEEGFREIIKMIGKDKKYDFEWIRFDCVYGLAILRKMEGYDYDKRHWTD